MALIIPESIPSTASQGEQRLFNILKTKLPKDFVVWYEPRLQGNLYPDFTILSPSFGLLIIEVKGWYAGTDDATFPTVMPDAALRQGPKPTLYQAGTQAKAVDVAIEQVQRLVMLGYSPSEIAILYRYKLKKDDALFNSMLQRLQDLGLPVYWVTESQHTKGNYSARRPCRRWA